MLNNNFLFLPTREEDIEEKQDLRSKFETTKKKTGILDGETFSSIPAAFEEILKNRIEMENAVSLITEKTNIEEKQDLGSELETTTKNIISDRKTIFDISTGSVTTTDSKEMENVVPAITEKTDIEEKQNSSSKFETTTEKGIPDEQRFSTEKQNLTSKFETTTGADIPDEQKFSNTLANGWTSTNPIENPTIDKVFTTIEAPKTTISPTLESNTKDYYEMLITEQIVTYPTQGSLCTNDEDCQNTDLENNLPECSTGMCVKANHKPIKKANFSQNICFLLYFSGHCKCSSGKCIFQPPSHKGISCTNSSDCESLGPFTYCDPDNKCECQYPHYWDDDSNRCIESNLHTTDDSQCDGECKNIDPVDKSWIITEISSIRFILVMSILVVCILGLIVVYVMVRRRKRYSAVKRTSEEDDKYW